MSRQSVAAFLVEHAPDLRIVDVGTSTATVALAAAAHGLATGQIAKTLALWVRDEVVLLVLGGDARIDNAKYKARFGVKAKMLVADEVEAWTSHPVGGVCPFGLPAPLRVFAEVALRRYAEVLPAAGSLHAAIRVDPERLARLAGAEGVDVGGNR